MNKRRRYKAKTRRAQRRKALRFDPLLTEIFMKYADQHGYIAEKVMPIKRP